MPYIHYTDRIKFEGEKDVGEVVAKDGFTAGQLNYLISTLCLLYLRTNGVSYNTINSIVGVLECAKQEFYRRIAVPYEQEKIKTNGDIY